MELSFLHWLQEIKNNDKKAYCKVSETELRAQKNDSRKRGKSAKHKLNTT